VRQRVTYKVALMTHKVRASATPAYLSDLIQTHVPTRTLRSSDAPLLAVPRTRTELARRAFSVAAPSVWNSLPADIRLCESVPLFKRHFKNPSVQTDFLVDRSHGLDCDRHKQVRLAKCSIFARLPVWCRLCCCARGLGRRGDVRLLLLTG